MKTFKSLLQNITESGEVVDGGLSFRQPQTGTRSAIKDHGKGLFDLNSDANIRRVNAFLEAYFSKECLDLPQSIAMLRAKLNIIGFDFEYDGKEQVSESEFSFRLFRYGGTFGKSLDTPIEEFETTDGFEEGVKYMIKFNIEEGKGLYRVNAEVVQEADREG
jgi:hypothetical protein